MTPKDQLKRIQTKIGIRKIHSDSEFISLLNNEIKEHLLLDWKFVFYDRTSHHVFNYFHAEKWIDEKEQPESLTNNDQI